LKLVLFSDLHLDRAFAWMGAQDPAAARRRRRGLCETFQHIVELAVEEKADALLCGGDLYEQESLTPDTCAQVRQTLAEAAPLRIVVAPGNHDWLGPRSLYARPEVASLPNLSVFQEAALRPLELTEGVTLWGAAHGAPAGIRGFLEDFHVDRGGINLALFHGAELSSLAFQDQSKRPHAPFRAEQIEQAGLSHAFLGHYHRPADAPLFTYPGNPDPLSFGEDGPRGPVIITLAPDGTLKKEWRAVASTSVSDVLVDITGCASWIAVRERVRDTLKEQTGVLRVTLQGTLGAAVDLHIPDLHACVPASVDAATFHLGRIAPDYRLDEIAQEPTVRGRFVREVQHAGLPDAEARAILLMGLRALEGRDDLDVF
jgi:exonuclease SbcD